MAGNGGPKQGEGRDASRPRHAIRVGARHAGLLKDSAQPASLRLNRGLAEERRRHRLGFAAVTCSPESRFCLSKGFLNSLMQDAMPVRIAFLPTPDQDGDNRKGPASFHGARCPGARERVGL